MTNKEISQLKSAAHHLDPVVFIGKNGLTDEIIKAVDFELDNKELIKVKFNDFKEEKKEIARLVADSTKSSLITVIGNIAILFRQAKKAEDRKFF